MSFWISPPIEIITARRLTKVSGNLITPSVMSRVDV